jgi:hypothetical protein
MGTQQSGVLNLQIAILLKIEILSLARHHALKILQLDVAMQLHEHCVLFTLNLLRKKYMELH